MNQFYRGEILQVTVSVDNSDGVFTSPTMYAYIDNLDLTEESNIKEARIDTSEEISDANYAKFEHEDGSNVFSLNGKQTRQLQDGHYTVELSYGNTDSNRIIVKSNNAFILVGSVSRFKNQG